MLWGLLCQWDHKWCLLYFHTDQKKRVQEINLGSNGWSQIISIDRVMGPSINVSDHLIPILYIKRKEVPDGWNVYASRQITSDNLSSDRHQILFLLKSLNKSEQLIYLYRIWESLLLSKYSINTAPHWLYLFSYNCGASVWDLQRLLYNVYYDYVLLPFGVWYAWKCFHIL